MSTNKFTCMQFWLNCQTTNQKYTNTSQWVSESVPLWPHCTHCTHCVFIWITTDKSGGMAMRTMSTMSTMRLVEIYGCEAVLVDAPYLRVDAWMVWLHGCWGMDVVHSIFNECHNDCSATHEIFIDAPVHPYPLHPGITTSSHPHILTSIHSRL